MGFRLAIIFVAVCLFISEFWIAFGLFVPNPEIRNENKNTVDLIKYPDTELTSTHQSYTSKKHKLKTPEELEQKNIENDMNMPYDIGKIEENYKTLIKKRLVRDKPNERDKQEKQIDTKDIIYYPDEVDSVKAKLNSEDRFNLFDNPDIQENIKHIFGSYPKEPLTSLFVENKDIIIDDALMTEITKVFGKQSPIVENSSVTSDFSKTTTENSQEDRFQPRQAVINAFGAFFTTTSPTTTDTSSESRQSKKDKRDDGTVDNQPGVTTSTSTTSPYSSSSSSSEPSSPATNPTSPPSSRSSPNRADSTSISLFIFLICIICNFLLNGR